MKKLRWGILGAARIARKNWKAIRHSGNGLVTMVASRDRERGEEFVRYCQGFEPFEITPTVVTDYATMLASPEVDAVYIPLPTTLRKEWVIRAAQAGKHVLCEKPCGAELADLDEMLAACRENKVQFMDGVMFMHHPRLEQIRTVLDDGTSLGPIRRIQSHFSFLGASEFFQQNIRVNQALEPLGSLGDLGWYSVRFSLWTMQWQMPREVTGRILQEVGGVPTAFSGELVFAGGVSAGFYCSFLEQHQQWASISGERGFLNVPDFVLPLQGNDVAFEVIQIASRTEGCDGINEAHTRRQPNAPSWSKPEDYQATNMFRHFGEIVSSGKPNPFWPDIARQTQTVVNACLSSARKGSVPVRL